MTEQYVHQQLLAECGREPFFRLADKSQAEMDFLPETSHGVVPLEAKSELNRRAKSLLSYCRRFKPHKLVRSSMGEYARHAYSYIDRDNTPCACPLVDIPLFGISRIMEEIES